MATEDGFLVPARVLKILWALNRQTRCLLCQCQTGFQPLFLSLTDAETCQIFYSHESLPGVGMAYLTRRDTFL